MNWQSTMLLKIANPHLDQREFHPRTAYLEPDIVEAFGSSTPPSFHTLFHIYHAPEKEVHSPVLLVPGANKSANFFLDPDENGSYRSLPEALRRAGRQVYGVTFAHNQDDNWWCCEAINECLAEISKRHPESLIDMLGHSKGAVSTRLAVTRWRPTPDCTRYLGDRVRRVVLLGGPNLGVDFFFRNPQANHAFYGESTEPILNWPLSWQEIKVGNEWRDCTAASYLGPYYPGQGQMLGRWDDVYPLDGKHPDQKITYMGGRGKEGYSLGMERVMEMTGSLIPEFRTRAPECEVALIGGTSPTIPGVTNDLSGPSDGIIYLKSALHHPEDARVCFMTALAVHHKALAAEPEAQAAIVEALGEQEPLTNAKRRQLYEEV